LKRVAEASPAFAAHPENVCLAALGGYGRMEMCLCSDIDLLVVYDKKLDKNVVEEISSSILYPFWNAGVEIGGATRDLDACVEIINEDAKALTAMLDARRVVGSEALFNELRSRVCRHFESRKNILRFLEAKKQERRQRLRQFGDTIFLLEPNVKEGEGGLRDFDTLRWMTKAANPCLFAEDELLSRAVPSLAARSELKTAREFIWNIRNRLHLLDGSRRENLTCEYQDKIALAMGFCDHDGLSAAENLMREYYGHASNLHLHCARAAVRIIRSVKGRSFFKRIFLKRKIGEGICRTEYGTAAFNSAKTPVGMKEVLKLFRTAQKMKLRLDPETMDAIASFDKKNHKPEWDAQAAKILLEILSDLPEAGRTLSQMYECSYLLNCFPEMRSMLHLVQHNGCHIYTAGKHSMIAVQTLCDLVCKFKRGNSVMARAVRMIKRPQVLVLAVLLHDLGKGGGEDHAGRGAAMSEGICKRLGVSERDVKDVSFLVGSHLLMSKIAFRRDLSDESLIKFFADSFNTPELLAMLYLLTCADIMAIGPNVWNSWKQSLLNELFEKTVLVMTNGEKSPAERAKNQERIKKSILSKLDSGSSRSDVDRYLSELPERYLYALSPETIAAHMLVRSQNFGNDVEVISRHLEEKGCTEMSILTKDRPGLFAKIAGILSAGGANIVDAQLYTTSDGRAIDVIWLTDAVHRPYRDEDRWRSMTDELRKHLQSDEDPAVFGKKFRRRVLGAKKRPQGVWISMENDVSAAETVVEIQADDRMGLLHAIACVFNDMGLSIERAMISTHLDRAIDVFYIREMNSTKFKSTAKLENLERALRSALED
jgi:[protein-PII] uridylyltransferase